MKMCQIISAISNVIYIFSVALRPNVGHGLPIREVSGPYTTAHHNRYDTSGRVIARRRALSLKTHNTQNRQTSMPPARFEPTVSVRERPQTHALVRAATGTSPIIVHAYLKLLKN